MDEKALVKLARAGDKEAFAKLYIQLKDKLFRYAYFMLGSTEDAQDAVSSCITAAYQSIASLKSEKAFSAWLFRILYRECCAILRHKAAHRDEQNIDDAEPVSYNDIYLAPELKEALSLLTEEEKDIVLLSAVAGYNSKEIAAMLNLKATTVRSKLSRSLAKMRNFLE